MRILHFCQFLGIGGLEQVLYLTIKEQIKQGHEVHLCVYDHDQRWVQKFKDGGIQVLTHIKKRKGIDLSLVSAFNQLARDYDIIHSHDLNPGFYLALLKLRNFFLGKVFHFIHTTHGMEHLKTDPKSKTLEALLGLTASRIITVSPKFKEFYQNQVFTKKSKVHLIENGTEITVDHSSKNIEIIKEFSLDQNKPIALYVARVVPLKGQFELINFYRELDHQLLVVGPSGDDDYYTKCSVDLPKHIKLTGARSDINNLIDTCDYYVSHSLHEGLPISVIEAGARKKPCLLYDIPGHSQFNKNEKCVELFNKSTFYESLDRLLNKRDSLIHSFYQLIRSDYSAESMTLKVLGVYEELISRNLSGMRSK